MRCGDEAYSYDAFGNQTSETEDTNPFLYCGEYFDYESGLLYLRARYYDSGVGGFISEDPAKDGLNWYVYCSGDPVNGWDPTGMYEMPEVLVRYAVEQAGGTVSYNGNTGATTIQLDGRTANIRAGDYGSYIVNGRLVIKAENLARALYGDGYSESQWNQFAPKEGQSFDRALDAVLAFSSWYGPASRNKQLEYGAAINYYGQNDYRLESISSSDDIDTVYDDGTAERRVYIEITDLTESTVHTHWALNGSLRHSEGDILSFPNQLNGYPNLNYSYVVNRYNEIYVMSRWYRESVRSSQL